MHTSAHYSSNFKTLSMEVSSSKDKTRCAQHLQVWYTEQGYEIHPMLCQLMFPHRCCLNGVDSLVCCILQAYKNYIKTVLTRVNSVNGRSYSEDPTVFSWELANEPTSTSDETGQTVCVRPCITF